MKVRNICILLAVMLAASIMLNACSSKTSSSDTGKSSSAAESSNTSKSGPKDPFEKHNPPIEIKTVRADLPVIQWPKGENMDNNVWYRTYEEELGIKVKNMWVVESTQLKQKTDLMIASGDIADLFQVDAIQFQQLLENNMIEDLSEVYKDYISDDAKRILTEGGPFAIDAATNKGKLMGIPFTGNQLESVPMFWLRTDWLNKLGLKVPKTQRELEDVMIAFATQDPDGNGKDDTFSLTFNKTVFNGTNSSNDAFFYSYHVYPDIWYDDGTGKLVWGGVQPGVKNALEALQRLYKEGAINKEFSTIDVNKAKEQIVADKVGIIYDGYYGSGGMLQPHCDAIKKYDIWQAYPLPSSDGKQVKLAHDTSTYGFHVVKKGYKHPEAAIQFLNMWIREFYVNTTDYDRYLKLVQNEKGTDPKWNLALCQAYRPLNNINNFRNLKKYVAGDKSAYDKVTFMGKSFYNGGKSFKEKGETTQWFWWVMHCPEYENPAMDITDKFLVNGWLQPNLFYGAPTATMIDKWKILTEKQAQVYQRIIAGAPLSELDDFIKEWNNLGGKQITEEINKWYTEHKNASDNEFVK